ncbi:hypothetical protein [Leucobacter sp. USHLN153]|uniref:hypothetical protein n=1 Tax=Leucobacter sp. USHLN153 TaxID=3081268 RepID=UPI00301A2542
MSRPALLTRLLPRRRNDYPGWLNALIDFVADHPMSLPGRIAALRLGIPRAAARPGVSDPGEGDPRLLIAPVNYSDQSTQWARAVREALPGASTATMAIDVAGGFSFPSDLVVPVPTYHNDRVWQGAQRDAVRGFTHVLVEAEEPLFGRLMRRESAREIAWMRASGIDVACIAHGTDIRVPSAHAEREELSPYRDSDLYSQRLERVTRQNITMLRESGRPLFVSTPDLLLDLPEAVWCPVVVDPDRWAAADTTARDAVGGTGREAVREADARPASEAPDAAAPLRVLHAPSVSLVKGTQLVEPVLHRLEAEGIISYRAIRGVPAAEMPAAYAEADIVLDQFRLGSYGVAACEAMAAGKLVIGHISEQVRQRVREDSGLELPIVEATPESLEGVLREIARDRAALDRARAEGTAFVKRWHSGGESAAVLIRHWIAPEQAATHQSTASPTARARETDQEGE